MSDVFDAPSLWRLEAACALDLDGDDLIAALTPGAAFPAVLRSIVGALPVSCGVIVDIGSGSGGASEWIRRTTGATVIAVEPAEGSRAAAVRAFPELHVIGGTAHAVPIRDAVADVVIISGVISLLDDLAPVITEVDRMLKHEGRVAIGDLFSNRDHGVTAGPNRFRTFEEVRQVLARRSLVITSVGLGRPEPQPSWSRIADAIDEWINTNCQRGAGYADWVHDQQHLARQVASGNLVGGCVVAGRSSAVTQDVASQSA